MNLVSIESLTEMYKKLPYKIELNSLKSLMKQYVTTEYKDIRDLGLISRQAYNDKLRVDMMVVNNRGVEKWLVAMISPAKGGVKIELSSFIKGIMTVSIEVKDGIAYFRTILNSDIYKK